MTASLSSSPSSTASSARHSEASDDLLNLVRRLTDAAERMASQFDELILAVRLLVGGRS